MVFSEINAKILDFITFVILLLLTILFAVVFIRKILQYVQLKCKASRKCQGPNDQVALRDVSIPVEPDMVEAYEDIVGVYSVDYLEPTSLSEQTAIAREDVKHKEVKESKKPVRTELMIVFICVLMVAFVFILHVCGYPASKIIGLF